MTIYILRHAPLMYTVTDRYGYFRVWEGIHNFLRLFYAYKEYVFRVVENNYNIENIDKGNLKFIFV